MSQCGPTTSTSAQGYYPRVTVEHLSASASPDEVAAVLQRDGVVVVDKLADSDLLDTIRGELASHVNASRVGPDDFSGHNTTRTGALIARSPASRQLIMQPLVLESVKQVLGHATNFQLHLTQAIVIAPGEPAQLVHRDQWAFDFFPFPHGYEVQCNTMWAVDDFSEGNGATRVIAGSHLYEDRLTFCEADTEPAEMAKGSVLFYTGAVYHGGGANRSTATRMGINITYNLAWLRQEENQYLSVPLDVARDLPEDLLRLIGYTKGAYALGYVDDLRDPIEVVRPDLANPGFAAIAH